MARHAAFARMMASRFGRDRWNEHVKLAAGMFNAIGVAAIIGAFVAPLINETPRGLGVITFLAVIGMILHLVAQYVLRYIARKE